jgi:uroporphyrinogen decarboxylase
MIDSLNLPKPDPDFGRLLKVLRRQGEPDRVPFLELLHDAEIMEAVLGRSPVWTPGQPLTEEAMGNRIEFWRRLGYDFLTLGIMVPLGGRIAQADDTAELPKQKRGWIDESKGLLTSRADFETYPWPDPERTPDYRPLELAARLLPEGMKLIGSTSGVFEHLTWLMGYETMSVALLDDPQLIQDVVDRVGEVLLAMHRTLASHPAVGAVLLGDDMGFKTATMVSPAHLRKYVFPWQKRLGAAAHAQGKPFLLHSCGNLAGIMEDLIGEVGIDAKHSFEDVITPVAEAKRLWGDRVAILGGIDVDYLSRHSEDEVRAYTRRVIAECAPGGGWALGSGNSVANYIPVRNFLAMLEEGRRAGKYSG